MTHVYEDASETICTDREFDFMTALCDIEIFLKRDVNVMEAWRWYEWQEGLV